MTSPSPRRTPLSGGARQAGWPVLELLVAVAVQLLLTPLLLHRLGAAQFGVWVLAQSALLAAGAMSFGASAGVLPVLSAAWQRGDVAGARAALGTLGRRVALMAALGLVAIAVAAAVGFTVADLDPSWWAVALAVLAWMAVTDLDNAAASTLKAQGRFGFAAATETAARLVQLGLVAAFVAAGSAALAPVLLSLAVTGAKLGVRLAALRGGLAVAPDATSPVPRELAVTGAWIWAGSLGSLAFNAFDRWFVGAWFGASTLAAYAVCVQLTQLPHAAVAAAGQVLVPWAARPGERERKLRLLAGTTLLAALPSLLLLPLLEPLLALWISPAFAQEHLALARGLCLAFGLLCLNVPGYFLLLGLGRARFATLLISACGLLFVAGAWALPHELASFVWLKAGFAALSLGLPLGAAWYLRRDGADR